MTTRKNHGARRSMRLDGALYRLETRYARTKGRLSPLQRERMEREIASLKEQGAKS